MQNPELAWMVIAASLWAITLKLQFFVQNHSPKKWLKLWGAVVLAYMATVYLLAVLNIIPEPLFGPYFSRPGFVLLVVQLACETYVDLKLRGTR
jgi:hypothetical protein